jgi:hypothetical protein
MSHKPNTGDIERLMTGFGVYCVITADAFGADVLVLVLHAPDEQVHLAFMVNAGGVAGFMLGDEAHRRALDAIHAADAVEDHTGELAEQPIDDKPLTAENMSGSIGPALKDLAAVHHATEAVVYLAREGGGPQMAWKYEDGTLWAGAGEHGTFDDAFLQLTSVDVEADAIPITPLVRDALGDDFPDWIDTPEEETDDPWRRQLFEIFDAELPDEERQQRLKEHLARLDPADRRQRVLDEVEATPPELRRKVLDEMQHDVKKLPGFPENPMEPTDEEKWIEIPGVDARRVRMTKGAEFLFEVQAQRFRERFGRDPVFFDPDAEEPRPFGPSGLDVDLWERWVSRNSEPTLRPSWRSTAWSSAWDLSRGATILARVAPASSSRSATAGSPGPLDPCVAAARSGVPADAYDGASRVNSRKRIGPPATHWASFIVEP